MKLRPAPDTSGDPVRSIYGTDVDDAIHKELQRLEAESAGEPYGQQLVGTYDTRAGPNCRAN